MSELLDNLNKSNLEATLLTIENDFNYDIERKTAKIIILTNKISKIIIKIEIK